MVEYIVRKYIVYSASSFGMQFTCFLGVGVKTLPSLPGKPPQFPSF